VNRSFALSSPALLPESVACFPHGREPKKPEKSLSQGERDFG